MNKYLRQFLEKSTTLNKQKLLEVIAHILLFLIKKEPCCLNWEILRESAISP